MSSTHHSHTPTPAHSPDFPDKKIPLHLQLPYLLVQMRSQRLVLHVRLCAAFAKTSGAPSIRAFFQA